MRKPTLTKGEARALQTFTFAEGMAIGYGLGTGWLEVAFGVVIFGLVMWLFTALER